MPPCSRALPKTCEVLKAGLPTRVPHKHLLGPSGVGGAPKAVASLITGQPLVVRVALVLKLYDVPHDGRHAPTDVARCVSTQPVG